MDPKHLPLFVPTADTNVMIVDRVDSPVKRITYLDLDTGERWVEVGTCNQCGLCEIGNNEDRLIWDPLKKPGEPYACSDPTYGTRLELVCRPPMKAAIAKMAKMVGIEGGGCSLDFEVLEPLELDDGV